MATVKTLDRNDVVGKKITKILARLVPDGPHASAINSADFLYALETGVILRLPHAPGGRPEPLVPPNGYEALRFPRFPSPDWKSYRERLWRATIRDIVGQGTNVDDFICAICLSSGFYLLQRSIAPNGATTGVRLASIADMPSLSEMKSIWPV